MWKIENITLKELNLIENDITTTFRWRLYEGYATDHHLIWSDHSDGGRRNKRFSCNTSSRTRSFQYQTLPCLFISILQHLTCKYSSPIQSEESSILLGCRDSRADVCMHQTAGAAVREAAGRRDWAASGRIRFLFAGAVLLIRFWHYWFGLGFIICRIYYDIAFAALEGTMAWWSAWCFADPGLSPACLYNLVNFQSPSSGRRRSTGYPSEYLSTLTLVKLFRGSNGVPVAIWTK